MLKMLPAKRRFFIFMAWVAMMVTTVSCLLLPAAFNSNINTRDPLYFDRPMVSTYEYNNGTDVMDLDFNVVSVGSNQSTLDVILGTDTVSLNYTFDGWYVPGDDPSTSQSIFWIHIIGGERSEFSENIGNSFNISDPAGLIGPVNASYNLTIVDNTAYWSVEPGLHGAQASLVFEITDWGGARVGSGLMDLTCGMVFELDVGSVSMRLLRTSYDISRNRIFGFYVSIPVAVALPVLAWLFIILKKRVKQQEETRDVIMDTVLLTGFAAATSIAEILVDV